MSINYNTNNQICVSCSVRCRTDAFRSEYGLKAVYM